MYYCTAIVLVQPVVLGSAFGSTSPGDWRLKAAMPSHNKKKTKSKAKASKGPTSSTQQQMISMVPMLMPPLPQRGEKSSSSSSSESCSSNAADKLLHRGATLVMRLPRIRIQQILEAVDPSFDSILTAEATVEDMCRILWVTAGTRPNTKVTNFRAKTYKDL